MAVNAVFYAESDVAGLCWGSWLQTCCHVTSLETKPEFKMTWSKKISCEWLSFACVVASLSMVALYVMVQTKSVVFPLVCPFFNKLLICTLFAEGPSIQGSQTAHNGHLSSYTLPEKAVISSAEGFSTHRISLWLGWGKALEDACNVDIKVLSTIYFGVLFIELNLQLI